MIDNLSTRGLFACSVRLGFDCSRGRIKFPHFFSHERLLMDRFMDETEWHGDGGGDERADRKAVMGEGNKGVGCLFTIGTSLMMCAWEHRKRSSRVTFFFFFPQRPC